MLNELVALIGSQNAMQRRSLEAAVRQLRAGEVGELERYVAFCTAGGVTLEQLAEAYNTITADTLREQIYFQRHSKYRCSRFSEVADQVYFNPDYMQRYMLGLALTAYLWPNHLELSRYFVRSLPTARSGRYLEIGPGHGLYFCKALELSGYDSFDAIDISETSIDLTRRVLEHRFGTSQANWRLHKADFLGGSLPHQAYDAIVMGEVLEHVEQPLAFLRRIRALAHPGAFIFVTTAINAPAIDHIYLFGSVSHVLDLVAESGLKCVDYVATPYPGCSLEDTVAQKLPINIALVLSADGASEA